MAGWLAGWLAGLAGWLGGLADRLAGWAGWLAGLYQSGRGPADVSRDVVLRALRNGRFALAGCEVALSRGIYRTKQGRITNKPYLTQLFIDQFRFPSNVPQSVGVPSPGYVCGNFRIA